MSFKGNNISERTNNIDNIINTINLIDVLFYTATVNKGYDRLKKYLTAAYADDVNKLSNDKKLVLGKIDVKLYDNMFEGLKDDNVFNKQTVISYKKQNDDRELVLNKINVIKNDTFESFQKGFFEKFLENKGGGYNLNNIFNLINIIKKNIT